MDKYYVDGYLYTIEHDMGSWVEDLSMYKATDVAELMKRVLPYAKHYFKWGKIELGLVIELESLAGEKDGRT